jgi:hypothetical protein
MELNLNSLLNEAARQLQSTRALPPELMKPQVIEALVLKSTLLAQPQATTARGPQPATTQLPPAGTAPPSLPAPPQARVELAWQGRVLQLLAAQPLPVGSQVRIEVTARGELKLLPPTTGNPGAPAAPRAGETPLPPVLQQSLRESLPRQRTLTELQPLLQRLLTPAQLPKLPPPLAAALQQLAATLPTSQQLQNPDGVRQALARSGNFLEARISGTTASAVTATATPAANSSAATTNAQQIVQAIAGEAADGDLKAQLLQLLALVRRFAPATPAATEQPPGTELLYTARPQPKPPAVAAAAADSVDAELEQLQQLNRLLQGGLARIQLNQIDAAASRAATGPDGQPPAPSWSFELPIQTQRGAENLQLRIEQQARHSDGVRQMQWRVQLDFDLHELGKLAATLVITGPNVSATLWAERQHTHRAVRAEVDHFKTALEGVGVRVTKLQCRLGLPPPQQHRWQQALVDVRT